MAYVPLRFRCLLWLSQIYDFLVVFPPQERVIELVKSLEKTEEDIFPANKPYSLLYSANTLSSCLREEALEVVPITRPRPSWTVLISSQSAPDQAFVSHSIRVVVSALTRPEAPESLPESPTKVQIAASLVECLLHALMGKLTWPSSTLYSSMLTAT
jgi:ubiquitin carboxyl-terminal hydrolase 34